jgi:hypothetical protein
MQNLSFNQENNRIILRTQFEKSSGDADKEFKILIMCIKYDCAAITRYICAKWKTALKSSHFFDALLFAVYNGRLNHMKILRARLPSDFFFCACKKEINECQCKRMSKTSELLLVVAAKQDQHEALEIAYSWWLRETLPLNKQKRSTAALNNTLLQTEPGSQSEVLLLKWGAKY